jgi:hypothetical protein
MRRALLAIGAAMVLAVAALPTTAMAQHHHFGGHFGHFGGPGIALGFGLGAPYYNDYAYAPGCSHLVRVWTPYGWRLRRVWDC